MDGNQNITVSARKNISINAAQDINMTAGKNFNISVAEDMNTNIENNNTVMITKKHQFTSDSYDQSIKTDKDIAVGGNLEETTASTTHKAKSGDNTECRYSQNFREN